MESNKISVVIPVYNATAYIERCIKSILNQSYEAWELILVNDGSNDDSLEKCIAFQQGENRVNVFNQINLGPSVARNNGIEKATGKYIVFVDADDYVDEFYLEKLLQPFLNNSDIELSCGGYIEFSKYHKKGLPLHDFEKLLETNSEIQQSTFFENLFNGVTGVLWGKMFLTEIIKEKAIALNPEIKLSEDLLFVFEYASHIKKIALVKDHLYCYNRLNENSLSGRLTVSNLYDIKATNSQLKALNFKGVIADLESILVRRYIEGIIKITKDIAVDLQLYKNKIQNLELINQENLSSLQIDNKMNKENKFHLYLFRKKYYRILIAFNMFLFWLRNLKYSI